jgi:hypothetical protein
MLATESPADVFTAWWRMGERMGRTQIELKICCYDSGLRANLGGPAPPTACDTQHHG